VDPTRRIDAIGYLTLALLAPPGAWPLRAGLTRT
jgi:hypothetical protein